jgi:hypothetical protein
MKLKQKKCRDFLNATFLEMSKLQTQGKPGAMLYWPLRAKDLPSGNLRMLPKKSNRPVCQPRIVAFLDADLAARICQKCEPFLAAAETALLTAKYGHPSDFLVFVIPNC